MQVQEAVLLTDEQWIFVTMLASALAGLPPEDIRVMVAVATQLATEAEARR